MKKEQGTKSKEQGTKVGAILSNLKPPVFVPCFFDLYSLQLLQMSF